jgi:transcriptional regulator with XRE-family HTH domain
VLRLDANAVKEKRVMLGQTQDKFCSVTGMSKAFLSRIETGKANNVTIGTINALALGLGISPSELLTEGEKEE